MSEQSASWFAIPLHHLQDPTRRAVVARRLGQHVDDLDQLLASRGTPTEMTLSVEDLTLIELVHGVPCLVWSEVDAADGGEAHAICLTEAGIPFLRWWAGCTAYSGGAAVFTGRGTARLIRVDADLAPIIGLRIDRARIQIDRRELADVQRYQRACAQVLGRHRR